MPRPFSASPRPPRPGRRRVGSAPRPPTPRASSRPRRVPPPARSTSTRAQTRRRISNASVAPPNRTSPPERAPSPPASRRATRSSRSSTIKPPSARARRAQRRALSRWRDALNDASEHARERGPLLAAIRGWRLAAEATRARREVETLRRRVADATLVSPNPRHRRRSARSPPSGAFVRLPSGFARARVRSDASDVR